MSLQQQTLLLWAVCTQGLGYKALSDGRLGPAQPFAVTAHSATHDLACVIDVLRCIYRINS